MAGARLQKRTEIDPVMPPARPAKGPTFRVHIGQKIYGPVAIADLRRIPGFTLGCHVAPFGSDQWKPAYKVINLEQYFDRQTETENGFTRGENLNKRTDSGPGISSMATVARPGKRLYAKLIPLIRMRSIFSIVFVGALFGGGFWFSLDARQQRQITQDYRAFALPKYRQFLRISERLLSPFEP